MRIKPLALRILDTHWCLGRHRENAKDFCGFLYDSDFDKFYLEKKIKGMEFEGCIPFKILEVLSEDTNLYYAWKNQE